MLSTIAVEPSAAAPREGRGRGFDGVWSVLISTAYGNCGSYRAAVEIAGGRVASAGGDYAVSGYVSPSGSVAVTVSSGAGTATGYGALRGSYGGGRWRSSGGECAGSWSASRR
jgi:hypothetical protein